MEMISTDREFLPTLPSRASRKISKRSRFSERSFLNATWLAYGGRLRRFGFEAKLERQCFMLLNARNDMWDISEQFGPIEYVDFNGVKRTHRFDFFVEMKEGKRLGVAVRPQEKAAKLIDVLRLIASQYRDVIDEVRLFTNRDFSKAQAYNAELIFHARKISDANADEAL